MIKYTFLKSLRPRKFNYNLLPVITFQRATKYWNPSTGGESWIFDNEDDSFIFSRNVRIPLPAVTINCKRNINLKKMKDIMKYQLYTNASNFILQLYVIMYEWVVLNLIKFLTSVIMQQR